MRFGDGPRDERPGTGGFVPSSEVYVLIDREAPDRYALLKLPAVNGGKGQNANCEYRRSVVANLHYGIKVVIVLDLPFNNVATRVRSNPAEEALNPQRVIRQSSPSIANREAQDLIREVGVNQIGKERRRQLEGTCHPHIGSVCASRRREILDIRLRRGQRR